MSRYPGYQVVTGYYRHEQIPRLPGGYFAQQIVASELKDPI